ncbi:MAG: hypothetical protein JO061_04670, partial [Acidobacteriaceae bacterium]|nr:hypothetical protein [Acidobacteriaceae bacterium]
IVSGDVNVRRGDTGELVAAAVNAPLVGHDRVQTGPSGAAELELDYANAVRVAVNTDVGFGDLAYRHYQVLLGTGTIMYRVLRSSDAQVEIDTPNAGIRPLQLGAYLISVFQDGTTQLTVRAGAAEIATAGGSQQLNAGQSVTVQGNAQSSQFQPANAPAEDQFDQWNESRDSQVLASQSYSRMSTDIYGADDLDQYGRWVPSQYGDVWAPTPPVADWSPYSYGHWAWVDYYGWTWVDAAPWGWAPYHYGRWFWNTGYGWCWWPGARFGAAVWWHPALVGFFGFGGGGIGWAALAPFEVFHPWWGRWGFGFGYRGGFGWDRDRFGGFREAMFRNAAVRGGALTIGERDFGTHWGRFNPATRSELAGASFVRGPISVRPSPASYRFSPRAAGIGNTRFGASNQSFFNTAHFRSGNSFQTNSRSGFGRVSEGTRGIPPNLRSQSPQSGWQRFGDPGTPSNAFRQSFPATADHGGWHSFGQAAPVPRTAAPNYPAPSYSFRGGETQPRFNQQRFTGPQWQQHYSAPQPRYKAPEPHYSGGGGSSHGNGGGGNSHSGGGGHSSGGGGGHSSGGGGHRR